MQWMTTPALFRKSSYSSGEAACVEVADLSDGSAVRDSKMGDSSPVLTVSIEAFAAFVQAVKDGQLG